MINKIKDFLKNRLKRNRSSDFSDQDNGEEFSQDENFDDVDLEENHDDEPALFDEDDFQREPTLIQRMGESKDRFTQTFRNLIPRLKNRQWSNKELPTKSAASTTLSPSLSRLSDRFLSRESREPIHQLSLVLLVCGITYSLGKMSALFLRGNPQVDGRRFEVSLPMDQEFRINDLMIVKSANLFRTNEGPGSKKKVADTKCEKPQQASSLPIRLMNTVVLQDSVKSIASVQVSGQRDLKEYREGDTIDNLAKIFKITRLELLVKNNQTGICESITSSLLKEGRTSPISVMTPSQSRSYVANKKIPGIENVGNKFMIKKDVLDEKLKDIGAILTQARAVKIQNPDGSMSFKMTEMDPEGVFPILGLQEGDIITSINGKPIMDLNEVMSLFGKIKNIENLSLGIKREGAESVQDYTIKK
jgi:type II secretory pathway component PulC